MASPVTVRLSHLNDLAVTSENISCCLNPDDSEIEAPTASEKSRKNAMPKKNLKQKESAKKAMKQCGNAAVKAGVSPGAVVTLKANYRTHYNPEGLIAIVYDVLPTGGIRVCCEHGVITHDKKKFVLNC